MAKTQTSADPSVLYLTLVALYVLQEEFGAREAEWRLIAKKAKTYLKQEGIDKPDALIRQFSLKLRQ